MGSDYILLAAHYPFKGYYEDSFQCSTFLAAMWQLIKYKKQGYEIINLAYRKTIKIDTSNWNQITLDRGER